MTSVLSTLNPLFEKNQTLTKSIYTSFNRSKRDGVKKDSANALVNTDETESLHYSNDNLVFDSTSGTNRLTLSPEGNLTVTGNLTVEGVINGVCTNAISANGLSDSAKNALIQELDGRYMPLNVASMNLESLQVDEEIEGSIQKSTDSDNAKTAEALTDTAQVTLRDQFQTVYDERYVLQGSLSNLPKMKLYFVPPMLFELNKQTMKLTAEAVTGIGSFKMNGFTPPSDFGTGIAFYDTYEFWLEVRGTGESYVETLSGKSPGEQGIVSFFLKKNYSIVVPLSTSISSISKGTSTSAYVIYIGQGVEFSEYGMNNTCTTPIDFSLHYYSANYTKHNMTWTPKVTLRRVLFYSPK